MMVMALKSGITLIRTRPEPLPRLSTATAAMPRDYETAWMLLHKLRRAMVNVAREPGSWSGEEPSWLSTRLGKH